MAIVLQLSDPHLLQDPHARLRGVPTRQTLHDVLELARKRLPRIDRVVLTGDLAHDEHPATYRALRSLLGRDGDKALVLPGNHDDRAGLRAAFPGCPDDGEVSVRFIERVQGWCLVGLDSQITGENTGRIGPPQLAWLREVLAAHAEQPTVVFVHHAPIATGHPVLDRMGLLDAEALAEVLAEAPQVHALCNGHIPPRARGNAGSGAGLWHAVDRVPVPGASGRRRLRPSTPGVPRAASFARRPTHRGAAAAAVGVRAVPSLSPSEPEGESRSPPRRGWGW